MLYQRADSHMSTPPRAGSGRGDDYDDNDDARDGDDHADCDDDAVEKIWMMMMLKMMLAVIVWMRS